MNSNRNLPGAVYLLVLICLFNSVSVPKSYSAVYKYINREGIECYTDSRDSIPAELRKKAVKINRYEEGQDGPEFSDTTGKKKEAVADRKEETPGTSDKVSQFSGKISDSRLFKACIAFGVVIIAFISARKIGEAVGGRYVSTILRIAFTVGLLLFLYDLFSKEMVNTYEGVREMTSSVKDVEENRDRKISNAINELFPEPKKEQ